MFNSSMQILVLFNLSQLHTPKQLKNLNSINIKFKYARHLVSYDHVIWISSLTCNPLHICEKGRIINGLEVFEIYRAHTNSHDFISNDQLDFECDLLYDTTLNLFYQRKTSNLSVVDQMWMGVHLLMRIQCKMILDF